MDTDKEEPRSNLTGPELPLYVKPLPRMPQLIPMTTLPGSSYCLCLTGEKMSPKNLSGIAKASHLE